MTDRELALTCLHEAGHVVACFALFPEGQQGVTKARIFTGSRPGELGGQVSYSGSTRTREELEKDVVVSIAGAAAEELFGRSPMWISGPDAKNLDSAFGALGIPPAWRPVVLAEARGKALSLLKEHRALVVRFAEHLLQQKALDAGEIREVLESVGTPPPDRRLDPFAGLGPL